MLSRRLATLVAVALSLFAAGCSETKPDCKGTAQVCGGSCVELKSDNLHCGACGAACGNGQVCSNGACAVTCAAGQVNCGGHCIDPSTDRAHCGASGACTGGTTGAACGDGQLCGAGQCVQTCASTQSACPSVNPTYCASLETDANNCGGCGLACAAGQQCAGSTCSCPAPTPDACSDGAGQAFCTSTLTDRLNCGACGNACKAGELCDGTGHCLAACPLPLVQCGGTCIDPHTDSAHCGASGDCAGVAAGSACLNGRTCSASRCEPAWQPISSSGAPAARSGHAAAALGARFYVFGGTVSGTDVLSDGAAYDPASDSWSALPALAAARCDHAAASTGNAIYAFGGLTDCSNGFTVGPGLEVFDGTSWAAIDAAGAPNLRYNFPMTWTGSELFLYGGSSDLGPALSTGGRFDPVTRSWSDASCSLADCQRGGRFSTFLDGTSIRLWGGGPYGSAPQGLQFDLPSGTWSPWTVPTGTPADIPSSGSTSADDGQRIYVLTGAADCSGSVQVQIFDRRTGQWGVDSALAPAGLSGLAATAWVGGELVVWSGPCSSGPSGVGGRYQPPPPAP